MCVPLPAFKCNDNGEYVMCTRCLVGWLIILAVVIGVWYWAKHTPAV